MQTGKRTYPLIIALLLLLATATLTSCEQCDCELLTETPGPDPNPDPDPDPDPVNPCNGPILIMQALYASDGTLTFLLDSIEKPLATPLAFHNITTDPEGFDPFPAPSNQSAYDAVTNRYFIQFPREETFYVHDIGAGTVTPYLNAPFIAPVVATDGELYAAYIDGGYTENPAEYSIVRVNGDNGTYLPALVDHSFPNQSPFDWDNMSSTALEDGRVFFLSYSNLIEYDPAVNATQHFELLPDWGQPGTFETLFGLETRANGRLLAIYLFNNEGDQSLQLLEIDPDDPADRTVVFDFRENGITDIDRSFHSTAYDPCDDTYYLTTRSAENPDETIFYAIDLREQAVVSETVAHYVYGVQVKR